MAHHGSVMEYDVTGYECKYNQVININTELLVRVRRARFGTSVYKLNLVP